MAATSFCNRIHNSTNASHSQLVRSLERILEEANISGELILTNRKLKDFPKTATKFNLSDTIMADLSRNRFCELPEEVTTFAFLETLLLYHNTIRHIPESVQHLTSLTFLDLRSNHISVLPKELCFMPLQVLLISNNRLVSLPDELGRMDKLTDLDASYNQLTALPPRIGELRNLKSLSLRNNQILYLSRELACLSLVFLDVSNNKITNLPLEMRQMTTLVEFNLENNPLASPPASLCIRGLVHIFKFLETQATKDEKGFRSGGNYDGYTTLQRTPKINSGNLFESTRNPRNQSETQLYNTYDGSDKHWSRDLHSRNFKTDISTPKKVVSPGTIEDFFFAACTNELATIPKSGKKATKETVPNTFSQQGSINDEKVVSDYANSTSSPIPDDEMLIENHRFNDKNFKQLGNVQTYREYKEALKQQRNQETSSRVYKAKGKTTYDIAGTNEINYTGNSSEDPEHYRKEDGLSHWNGSQEDSIFVSKKPIQTVVPVRITEPATAFFQPKTKEKNSNQNTISECLGYVKPDSPIKTNCQPDNSINNNSVPVNGGNKNKFLSEIATKSQQQFLLHSKTQKSVTWNQEVSSEKLSFTMRREFDRQREETELLMQLRNIIQSCLKTVLPEDVSSALADGVVLCHLANYVRPRSVASIHVPSPGVSKLTMARCRRNVDNFLEACRKIGVDENLMCCAADVLEGKGVVQVAITVCELFRLHSNCYPESPSRIIKTSLSSSTVI